MTPGAFRYSRWDGTQVGFELDAGDVLAEIADDVLYHGDLDWALRRLLQSGFRDRNGEPVAGLRELMERLRRRREEELGRHELGGVYDEIAKELREVIDQERQAVDDAGLPERHLRLDLLPPDLAGQVRELSQYDFVSPSAASRFEELVDRLRSQVLQSQFNRMSGAMANVGPEELQRTKDMLAALNRMLEQRAAGEEPDFDRFMQEYGDYFPERPRTLDELLEQMARQMAAMQALLNSMTPEQRAELRQLSDQLLSDMDLRWQLDQLGAHLQAAFPQAGWDNAYSLTGDQSLDLPGGAALMGRLADIDQLENLLGNALSPNALAEVDPEAARELLGDDGARSLERLAELARMLEDAGLIGQTEGRLELTPRGLRRIGAKALADLFGHLDQGRLGQHPVERTGTGHERSYETRPYEFGDPFHLDIQRTIRNALQRRGGGVPVALEAEDFEVDQTEALSRCSTVLMLDLSLSMPMRDNFLAAKKVAIALHSLIQGQFPHDRLDIVAFSRVARELRPHQLPEVSWDFDFGTNMQHGLLLARRLLARETGTRQILMITDGEPTAHITPDGGVLFNYPPLRETVEATLAEVGRCTRAGIRINTFMLDATPALQHFVETMTRMNCGRAFFTTPDTLGDYVLVDFLDQRRALRASRR